MDLRSHNLKQTVSAIEDLRSLVASDFHAIADQALHHVEQLKQNCDHDWAVNQKAYASVCNLMEGQLKSLFEFYAKNNPLLAQIQFNHDKETFSLTAWNKLLSSLDLVLRSVSLFNFTETLDVKLMKGHLVVSGKLKKFKLGPELRVKTYALIRQFLALESVFTYDVMEMGGEAYLSLRFDYSHRAELRLDFSTNQGKNLSFSNILSNYEVTNLEKFREVKHLCLEVDSSYQLYEREMIPEEYFQAFYSSEANFSVFHFSFLFRPISLIIPMRGDLSVSGLQNQAYVDFFSLINK